MAWFGAFPGFWRVIIHICVSNSFMHGCLNVHFWNRSMSNRLNCSSQIRSHMVLLYSFLFFLLLCSLQTRLSVWHTALIQNTKIYTFYLPANELIHFDFYQWFNKAFTQWPQWILLCQVIISQSVRADWNYAGPIKLTRYVTGSQGID